jgi:glycosyltransferase involved in cell wall biosynthesis
MPSLLEATSLSAMEAMSSGKAILSTNVGGLPFLIRDDENGLLVPPANSQALAEGMRKLLADPELRARLGEAGRRRVEQDLDWSRIAEQTLSVYDKAIERHRRSLNA